MRPPSFESLYEEWSSYVYSLAYRLAGNKADAEDLAQEAFLRVFRFLKDYKGGSLKGWLYKIVTNTFYLKVEKDKRAPLLPGDEQLVERISAQEDLNVSDLIERHDLEEKIHQAIRELSPDYRVAVVLADLEELNYQEISAVLNVPIGTVRSRISRGRHLLREKLSEERRKTG